MNSEVGVISIDTLSMRLFRTHLWHHFVVVMGEFLNQFYSKLRVWKFRDALRRAPSLSSNPTQQNSTEKTIGSRRPKKTNGRLKLFHLTQIVSKFVRALLYWFWVNILFTRWLIQLGTPPPSPYVIEHSTSSYKNNTVWSLLQIHTVHFDILYL